MVSVLAVTLLCWAALCHASGSLQITTRTQSLQRTGRIRWSVNEVDQTWNANETAIIIVDMWNQHWCVSATERVGSIAILLNDTITVARQNGMLIIHAPSDCSGWYTNYSAREWVLGLEHVEIPTPKKHVQPDFPIDSSDGGCDIPGCQQGSPWTHETDYITIYPDDAIIDNVAQEFYNVLYWRGIKNIVYTGVHENMCLMNREFSIEASWGWGFNPVVCRELVDTMYDPSQVPYVTHEEGTQLMTEFVEKFWAPSVSAYDLLNPRNGTYMPPPPTFPNQKNAQFPKRKL
eukprot:TRINITY_DN6272_c0_g1_i4.p1 TRINITY_DN6272_c0_g1~~TRINITY_DN6272_c0_g1_i4.p1  ORF type:complete len:290 (+),score=68.43 TRINITY_DN6272_c0_g1_i4:35-904(+)